MTRDRALAIPFLVSLAAVAALIACAVIAYGQAAPTVPLVGPALYSHGRQRGIWIAVLGRQPATGQLNLSFPPGDDRRYGQHADGNVTRAALGTTPGAWTIEGTVTAQSANGYFVLNVCDTPGSCDLHVNPSARRIDQELVPLSCAAGVACPFVLSVTLDPAERGPFTFNIYGRVDGEMVGPEGTSLAEVQRAIDKGCPPFANIGLPVGYVAQYQDFTDTLWIQDGSSSVYNTLANCVRVKPVPTPTPTPVPTATPAPTATPQPSPLPTATPMCGPVARWPPTVGQPIDVPAACATLIQTLAGKNFPLLKWGAQRQQNMMTCELMLNAMEAAKAAGGGSWIYTPGIASTGGTGTTP